MSRTSTTSPSDLLAPYPTREGTLLVPAPDSVKEPKATVPAPADLTEDELKAFEEMVPALREKAVEMRNLMKSEVISLLDSRYKLGSLVHDVKKDPKTYGPMSDIQLATFFGDKGERGKSGKTVYAEARRIRERYTPEQFEELKNSVNPENGARITYKHVAILLRLEDLKEADKALNECLHAGWSTTELANYVSKRLRTLSGKAKKPSRSRPANILGMLENVAAVNGEWKRQYEEGWKLGQSILDAFNDTPAEGLNDDLAKRLKDAQEQAEAIAEAQTYLASEFKRLLHKIDMAQRKRRQGGESQVSTPQGDDEAGVEDVENEGEDDK